MQQILLVDDEDDVLSMMVDVLREQGYLPVPVSDGEEALELLTSRPVDAVVSDIMMPRLNGMRLLEAVKRGPRQVRVVLVTGYATRALALEALGRGASCVLEKPFTNDALVTAVRDALAGRP
jgi:DNA-binding NtrC family response regulator